AGSPEEPCHTSAHTGSNHGAEVTSRYLTSLEIDVSPDGGMIRCGVDRLCHLVIVREQRAVRASPYALAPDAPTRHAREHRWREEEIIDLVGLGAIPVGPWTPIALELRMGKNVPEIRPFPSLQLSKFIARTREKRFSTLKDAMRI